MLNNISTLTTNKGESEMNKYTKIGIDQMATNRQRMKELEKKKDVAEYLLCKKKESTFRKFVKDIFSDFVIVRDGHVAFKKYDREMLIDVGNNEFNLVGSKLMLPINIDYKPTHVKKVDATWAMRLNLNNFVRRSR